MKKANKSKRSLKERFCVKYDIPPDVFAGDISFTVCGRNKLTVNGKTRILLYSPERLLLEVQANKSVLEVCGVRLSPTVYNPDTLLIDGVIDSVEFLKADFAHKGGK